MLKKICTPKLVYILTFFIVLLFVGICVLSFWGIPQIIKEQIHGQTRLKEGTDQWNRFLELPFPLDYSVRFFEVKNIEDIINKTAKPILKETDPYNYKLNLKKLDLRYDDINEDSVTYRRIFNFTFDNNNNNKETEEVTIINPLMMAALQLTTGINRIVLAGCIEKLLGPSDMDKIFIKKRVNDLLFNGIKFAEKNDTLIGVACEIVRKKMIKIVSNVRVIEHVQEIDGNDYLKLSFFNYKTANYLKDSPDGVYTVNMGNSEMYSLGKILRWNGEKRLKKIYGNSKSTNNETCEILEGTTDSTIYRPQIEQGAADLTIFNTDICRKIKLVYKKAELYNGIQGNRYETSEKWLRPNTLVKENDCYCSKATKDLQGKENCYLDGVFDFQPCLGAPGLLSQPHFLNADNKYLEAIQQGLKPNKEAHVNYLILEPNTGTPLQGMKRVQMNVILKKENFLSFITPETLYEGVVPFLWIEEGFSLPQEYIDLLNNQYFNKVHLATGLKYGFLAISSALVAACLYGIIRINC